MTEYAPDYELAVICENGHPLEYITTFSHYAIWRPLGTAWAPEPQLGNPGQVRYESIMHAFDGVTGPERIALARDAWEELDAASGTPEYARMEAAYTARKETHMSLTLSCLSCGVKDSVRLDRLDSLLDKIRRAKIPMRHADAPAVSLLGFRYILNR